MRKLLLLSMLLSVALLLPPSSRAQFIVVGQGCGASGLSAIANDGTPVVCRGNPLVWTAVGGSGGGSTAAFNSWTRLGTVIGTPFTPAFAPQEVGCFIQTNPQVLSANYTQVVACLYTSGTGVNYAEAPTPTGPFTDSASNPAIANANCVGNVQSIGGQLVTFACVNGRTDIGRFHSTTNGISWVSDGSEILHGGGGWKNGYVENPMALLVGSTCHLWFEGSTVFNPPFQIGQGHATGNSTCGHGSFTEDAGNPVIPVSECNCGGPFVFYDGTNFWNWEHGTPGGSADAFPTNIFFTKLNTNGSGTPAPHTHTLIFQARTPDEGGGNQNTGNQNSQVADPFLLEWPYAVGDLRNTTYMFYEACATGCAGTSQFTIKVASISGPMKNIVNSTQGDVAPIVNTIWANANGAQFDDGQRANAGTLGPKWTVVPGNVALQVVSNKFEPTSTATGNREGYSFVSFPLNHYSSVQLIAGAATSQLGPIVRANIGNGGSGNNFYDCITVAALGGSQSMLLRKIVGGAATNLVTFTATPAVNDIWELDAVGTLLTCKQNGVIRAFTFDSSLATGVPGIEAFDSAAVGNAILANWVGGPL